MSQTTIPATVIDPNAILKPLLELKKGRVAVEQQRVSAIQTGISDVASGFNKISLDGSMKDQAEILKLMEKVQEAQIQDYINSKNGILTPEQRVKHSNQLAQLKGLAIKSKQDQELLSRAQSGMLRNPKGWDFGKATEIFNQFEQAPIGSRNLDLSGAVKKEDADIYKMLGSFKFKPTEYQSDEGTSYDWSELSSSLRGYAERNPTLNKAINEYAMTVNPSNPAAARESILKGYEEDYINSYKPEVVKAPEEEDEEAPLQWKELDYSEPGQIPYLKDRRKSVLESGDFKSIGKFTFEVEDVEGGTTLSQLDATIENIEVVNGQATVTLIGDLNGDEVRTTVPYDRIKAKLNNTKWWNKGGYDQSIQEKIQQQTGGPTSQASASTGDANVSYNYTPGKVETGSLKELPIGRSVLNTESAQYYLDAEFVSDTQVAKFMTAMAFGESRNKERPDLARGTKIVDDGSKHNGTEAIGRFQIMPVNVVDWMKQYVGKDVEPGYVPTADEQATIAGKFYEERFNAYKNKTLKEKVMLTTVDWYGNMGVKHKGDIKRISKKGDKTLGKSPWTYANEVWEYYQEMDRLGIAPQQTGSAQQQATSTAQGGSVLNVGSLFE